MNRPFFKLLFITCLIFTIISKAMQAPQKGVGSTLPLTYQIVLRELKSTKFFLSPQALQVLSKNVDLQKMYNAIKDYSELGLSEDQAIEFVDAFLKLTPEKINALANFIEQIYKLLNYEKFPLSADYTERYSETLLAALPKADAYSIQMKDIAYIRKELFKLIIAKFILKYREAQNFDKIEKLLIDIDKLPSVYTTGEPHHKSKFERQAMRQKWLKELKDPSKNMYKTINKLILTLSYNLKKK